MSASGKPNDINEQTSAPTHSTPNKSSSSSISSSLSSSFRPFVASAPGKLILAGEHAVVHGTRALATVIDKRTYCQFTISSTQTLTLNLTISGNSHIHPFSSTDLLFLAKKHKHKLYPDTSAQKTYIPYRPALDIAISALTPLLPPTNSASICVFLTYYTYLYLPFVSTPLPLSIAVDSELPLAAGLGSSASYCAALVAGFLHLLSIHEKQIINAWTFEGERILHGTPSGVDNTCVVYGGVIVYQRGRDVEFISSTPPIPILITNTRIPRDTKVLVANVKKLHDADPKSIDPLFNLIDSLVSQWINLLSIPSPLLPLVSKLAPLIEENQRILNHLGVGHEEITFIVTHSTSYGYVSKLTGAGGGGCVMSIPVGESNKLGMINMCKSKKFDVIETVMGQEGVKIKENTTLEQSIRRDGGKKRVPVAGSGTDEAQQSK